jgi:hypothetical protein
MLIASTVAIFCTWVVMTAILAGIGSLVLSLFGRSYLFMDAFWMGLGVSTAALEIWSLAHAITVWVTALLSAAGVLGVVVNRASILARLRAGRRAAGWWILIPAAVVLFVALRASGPCDYSDTGLYGAPAIKWITTYPTVPGLANVHGRLGFNSSVFVFMAALNQGAWKGQEQHLFTGFMMAAMCVTLIPAAFRAVRKSPVAAADWFYCILLIPIVFGVARSKIVGTQTDEPAAIMALVAAGILFAALSSGPREDERKAGAARLVVAATLLALAVAFKLSTAVFALLAWGLVIGWIWRLVGFAKERRACLTGALAVSLLILLSWCVRGIILSGYPFFPATVLGLPVDWKLPSDDARWFAEGVRTWGRNPDAYFMADTQGLAWLAGWVNRTVRNRSAFQVPLGISLGGLGVGLGFQLGKRRVPAGPWLWLLVPSVAGVVFWFWVAPDPRFGQFAFWTMAGTLGTWGILALEAQGLRPGMMLTGLLALEIWCLAGFGWTAPYRALFAVKKLPGLPQAAVTVRRTSSGLNVYVPLGSDNCWDAPLPCAAYFDETLRLRDPESMRWGFTSQGRGDYLERMRTVPIR